ncbi:MAG: patatin-like phospholipase family protein [Bacteroidales bacterium]|nr:patatin-like phospholipase family protein [Bacteroidales bacterium]
MSKKVALVLASGGPRGFAYIGAIEELLKRGYEITSVAGTSAGSLIGGIYAAGGLEAFKQWIFGLDPLKVMTLMDISLSKNYLVKGEKVMDAIKERVPEVNIEDLPIPFVAVATDLYTGEEVIFREGPLFEAIRASISIPSMFKPVKWKGRTLVDGGMVNTFPLNRVQRTPGDILVGFNVNQIDAAGIQGFLDSRAAYDEQEKARREEAKSLLKDTLTTAERGAFLEKMARGGQLIRESIEAGRGERRLEADGREGWIPVDADDNYASILQRSFGIMNCTIARQGIELARPDVLADLPFDSYHGVYGYTHASEIVEEGRRRMADALDRYGKLK